jgi:DNA-binding NarL/FixJ family response regulator
VSDVRIYREGVAATLDQAEGLQIVNASNCGADTLQKIASACPDVVVLDMSDRNSMRLMLALRQSLPALKVVAFGVDGSEREILTCAEAGFAAYVRRDASVEDLVGILVNAARDELICSPGITATLFRRVALLAKRRDRTEDILTIREREVLTLIRDGLANKQIAEQCGIAEATVKNHVHNLLEKLQVKSRAQAANINPVWPSINAPSVSCNRRDLDPGTPEI